MTMTATVDPARREAFIHKVLEHASGTMTTLLAVIGDRLENPFNILYEVKP